MRRALRAGLHIMHICCIKCSMSALQSTYTPFPFRISHGAGDQIISDSDQSYLDFYGGHCVASTGHSHPAVVQAIQAQAAKLIFYSTAGELAIREQAAQALIDFARWPDAKVFFCNSGAEANENALKIAGKITGRKRLVSLEKGWHGRSTLCLSVTDDDKITRPYAHWLAASTRLPINDIAAAQAMDFSDVAAVILEPIQSMAGIRACELAFLQALRDATRKAGTLLIFDEIQTGIGRLGTPFAANFFGVQPDMITSAKGLASGVPMAAVLLSDAVSAALAPGDLGSTFGAGPIACAAMLATLGVIAEEQLMPRAAHIESKIRSELAALPLAILGHGALLGLKLAKAAQLKSYLFERRILLGTSSDPSVLRLMPPLNCTDQALATLIDAIRYFFQIQESAA
jgi:acetylornithine/N-succinyldiaminopimelate aminotransferase